jgi:hypothetical protein
MHEGEEVTPSTSSRKRRYKTSFRFSTMKELKRARVSKKKAIGITVKKSLMFNESNQELGNIAGSMTGDGISEIEEEKDGEDEPGNIIIVSYKSYPTSFSFFTRPHLVKGQSFDWMDMVAVSSFQLSSSSYIRDDGFHFHPVSHDTPHQGFIGFAALSSSSSLHV